MKNFDQLKEACVTKNDELINQFIQYKDESFEHDEDAFKSWVIQKLSLNEVILSKQQEAIIKFLAVILDQIKTKQKAIPDLEEKRIELF